MPMSMVSVEEAPKEIASRVTRAIMIRVQVQRRAGSDAIGSSVISRHPEHVHGPGQEHPPIPLRTLAQR